MKENVPNMAVVSVRYERKHPTKSSSDSYQNYPVMEKHQLQPRCYYYCTVNGIRHRLQILLPSQLSIPLWMVGDTSLQVLTYSTIFTLISY